MRSLIWVGLLVESYGVLRIFTCQLSWNESSIWIPLKMPPKIPTLSTTMSRIFHGEVTGDPYRPAKAITSYDFDPDVQVGDLCSRWDHYFVWDEACIPGKELEKLRWTGDDLCDEVVKFLGMGKGDMLVKLEEYMSTTPRDEWDVCVRRFWESVERQPPNGVDTSKGTFRPNFECQSKSRTLSRGQEVFWKYISPILTSLLHFSLVGIPRQL